MAIHAQLVPKENELDYLGEYFFKKDRPSSPWSWFQPRYDASCMDAFSLICTPSLPRLAAFLRLAVCRELGALQRPRQAHTGHAWNALAAKGKTRDGRHFLQNGPWTSRYQRTAFRAEYVAKGSSVSRERTGKLASSPLERACRRSSPHWNGLVVVVVPPVHASQCAWA